MRAARTTLALLFLSCSRFSADEDRSTHVVAGQGAERTVLLIGPSNSGRSDLMAGPDLLRSDKSGCLVVGGGEVWIGLHAVLTDVKAFGFFGFSNADATE